VGGRVVTQPRPDVSGVLSWGIGRQNMDLDDCNPQLAVESRRYRLKEHARARQQAAADRMASMASTQVCLPADLPGASLGFPGLLAYRCSAGEARPAAAWGLGRKC
jgi:hypothetical protein